jgi:hypothetical protein
MNNQERLYSKIMPEPNTGCWLYLGGVNWKGYGSFWMNGKGISAHRASYIFSKGEIKKGLSVLHHCDTPSCINPDHLYLGTDLDNAADRKKRGRYNLPSGPDNCNSILSWETVREIRVSGLTMGQVSKKYNIHKMTAYNVLTHKSYKHDPGF